MRVLMISKSEYQTDVRVRREAEALRDAGHEVTVIDLSPSSVNQEGVSIVGVGEAGGLTTRRPSRKSVGFRFARWLLLPEHRSRAVRQFQAASLEAARDVPIPDVVHAHDFPALVPAAEIARARGSRLIYDSHEFWRGTQRPGRPHPITTWRESRREEALAREAEHILTVSPGAAALLQESFGLNSVTVVKNTFPPSSLEPPPSPSGALYAGRLGPGRDLTTLLSSSVWSEDFPLTLMGPGDFDVGSRPGIKRVETGTMDEVDAALSRSGIAVVSLDQGPVNHDIALPNKLFQALAIGVPVVASNLPELHRVVTTHGVGSLYRCGDPVSLANSVAEVRARYSEFTRNVRTAQVELNWSSDAETLLRTYGGLR